jgi:hypothetical protein
MNKKQWIALALLFMVADILFGILLLRGYAT